MRFALRWRRARFWPPQMCRGRLGVVRASPKGSQHAGVGWLVIPVVMAIVEMVSNDNGKLEMGIVGWLLVYNGL